MAKMTNGVMPDFSDLADMGIDGLDLPAESNSETEEIEIDKLVPFKNHPFTVDTEGPEFDMLTASIKEQGVIYPVLVRKFGDKYEIISGHRRVAAAKAAGLTKVPVIVRNLNDYDATIAMVHTNLHREKILPSEKAKAFSMCFEEAKKSGKKVNENDVKERQMYNYARLVKLPEPYLKLIDDGKLAIIAGVHLSYLDETSFTQLDSFIADKNKVPKPSDAQALRDEYEENGTLTYEKIEDIMTPEDEGEPKPPTKIGFKIKEIRDYFPENTDAKRMEGTVKVLLSKYKAGEITVSDEEIEKAER